MLLSLGYVGAVWLHGIVVRWTQWEASRVGINSTPALPDIIHRHLPAINAKFILFPDIALIFWCIFTASAMYYTNNTYAMRHLLLAHGTIVLMRALCVGVTLFPTPLPDNISFKQCYLIRWYVAVVVSRNDLMFSGHTALYVLLGCTWTTYLNVGSMFYCIMIWTAVFILSLSLIMARQHYTVDVLVAAFLSLTTFYSMKSPYPDSPIGISGSIGDT